LDDYQITDENFQHWWNMAQRRWQWCWRSGKLDLAAQSCSQAMSQTQGINKLEMNSALEAQRDLDSIMLEAARK
jgi:hypothetical protein